MLLKTLIKNNVTKAQKNHFFVFYKLYMKNSFYMLTDIKNRT